MNKVALLLFAFISILSISCSPKPGTARSISSGDSLSFIVIGDWGVSGLPSQKAVAHQMDSISRRNNVQFIITTGDNFYPTGVTSVTDPHWQNSFENIYNQEGHMVPWYPTLGNHDYNGSPDAEIAYSKISKRWRLTAPYYSFRKKLGKSSVVFAFADLNPFNTSYYKLKMPELQKQDTAAQYQWLEKTLSEKADWKIMIGHQPLYSIGSYENNTELISRFKPLLLKTGTQFYIAGHDHNLQHLQLPDEPVNYLVSGGGGRGLYPLKNAESVADQFALSSNGFLLMTVYPNKVRFCFYNEKGEILYQQEIRK